MLGYWLYLSDALSRPRSIDDALIYLQACNRNPARGITGYLHREDAHYAQYIEGPVEELTTLRATISRDGRHRNVRSLMEGAVGARRFAGWDMAFSTAEMTSFRLFQRRRGRREDLATAPAADLLGFMEDTASRGAPAAVEEGRSRAAA